MGGDCGGRHTKIMALQSWRMKMVYQAMPEPTSSSLGGYLAWNSVTWVLVRPLSMLVLRSSATSSTGRRKGCFLHSPAITGLSVE